MFTITCSSCTAKLKVKNPQLVGQVLACPKCGSMIKIEAPDETALLAPETEDTNPAPAKPPIKKTVSSEAPKKIDEIDFSEIEKLIREQEAKEQAREEARNIVQQTPPPRTVDRKAPAKSNPLKKEGPKTSGNRPRAQTASPKPVGTGASSAGVKGQTDPASAIDSIVPILPDANWVSPDAKKRQKLLLVVAASFGGLLILAATIFFAVKAFSPNKPIAKGPNDSSRPDEPHVVSPNNVDSRSDENNVNEPPITTEPDPVEPESIDAGEPDSITPPTTITETNPPSLPGIDAMPPALPTDSIQEPNPLPENGTPRPGPRNRQSLVDRIFDEPAVAPQALADSNLPFESLENSELKTLFQLADSSLDALGDVASRLQTNEFASTASVFIERVDAGAKKEPSEIVKSRFVRLSYKDISASRFLAEISKLANLPVTFHPVDFVTHDIDLGQKLTFDLQNGDLLQVFEAVAQEFKFEVVVTDWGILFQHPDASTIETREFPLPSFPEQTPEDYSDIVDGIKGMIAVGTWEQDSGNQMVLAGDKLAVTHERRVLDQVERLVAQITASLQLEKVDLDNLPLPLQTPGLRFSQRLNQRLEFNNIDALTLDEFADVIRVTTGVELLFDWPELVKNGWSHQVTVPLHFRPQTVDEAITELRRSMQVSFEFLDDRSLLLTTREAAWKRRQFEVYPIRDLIAFGTKPETVVKLLHQAVGKHVFTSPQNPITCSFYAKTQAVIVFGPQPIQRQIEAVLVRLRKKN
jgi:hypothetical protein